MDLLKVPAKFSRCGIKVKCLKCKWQLGNGKCYEEKGNKKGINKCNHKDKHRFNLVVCVPNTENERRMKLLETRDFNEAWMEMGKFKEELKISAYHRNKIETQVKQKTTFIGFAMDYLDFLSGINTPKHMVRIRSKDHIDDCRRIIERFCKALKIKNYNLEILDLKSLGDTEVGIYHEYLLDTLKVGRTTYNRHFTVMKSLINWVNKVREYRTGNPFAHAKLISVKKEKNMITKIEFEKLLQVTTHENGKYFTGGKNRNVYHEWLPTAFKLGLETGLRREELIVMKWSDMVELEGGKLIFMIDNMKVNRQQTGLDEGTNIRPVAVTKSLMKLLIELGYNDKKQTDEYVLERPKDMNLKYIMNAISRGFGHYIKSVTDRKLEFKDLRKTYITHITMALGDKAKLFTGHTNDEVLKNNYLSSAYLAGGLSEFNMF